MLLGPLQNKLRTQSIDNLRETVLGVQPQFEAALRPKIPPPKANETEPLARAEVLHRIAELRKAAFELGQRIDVRVAVDADDADGANPPDFVVRLRLHARDARRHARGPPGRARGSDRRARRGRPGHASPSACSTAPRARTACSWPSAS